jgi:DNA-binding transcriptional LysR family regulator
VHDAFGRQQAGHPAGGAAGTRLVNRSTRKLQLTPEGTTFYEQSTRVLADMDEAERGAAAGAMPRGRVSINASMPTAHRLLLPLVPAFHERFPTSRWTSR